MTSPDLTQVNIDKLAELFPTVVTESVDESGAPRRAINFDLLRQELADHIVEGPQERYQLDWPGKRAAAFAANAPIAKTLRPVREESVDFDTTKNLFIEGDNLDALKLLQESYLGKVKLIYIDPPYNTGNDFVYEDDFAESSAEYLARSGQKSETGDRLVANPESNGRFHSDWLSMMYPRLKLARSLLKDDGVIIAAIDDNEHGDLRMLMDLVFGADNFIADVVWQGGRKNDAQFLSPSTDYMLIYARDMAALHNVRWREPKPGVDAILEAGRRAWEESNHNADEATRRLKQWWARLAPDDEKRGSEHYNQVDGDDGRPGVVFFGGDMRKPAPTSTSRYDIIHPVTGKPVNMHPNGWAYAPENMKRLLSEGRVKFGLDETTRPTMKRYLDETSTQTVMPTFYADRRAASNRLRALLGEGIFDFPKDERVLARWINLVTQSEPDALILDFFGGSGSTSHAVMDLNAADGGRRRYILVQLDEEIQHHSYESIAEVARERIRRAGLQIHEQAGRDWPALDLGFRALRVDTTNMADTLSTADDLVQIALTESVGSVKPDRTDEDLLFQVLLDWGLDLAAPIAAEEAGSSRLLSVDDDALIACFSNEITDDIVKTIAARHPLRAVFLDAGFATDSARINAEQIFREVSPETELRTI
ncbi:adenine-specific DNA-methyltransferase [Microterricola gilva]|uniref:Adenine-specific DNA-methyltransferase n=1 Tax=Microterricola gilva TaxID=393267 RepID=A0A4Q8ANB8_9MICO|nr:site-specific DNA-methyltransferase [Microterricola gilva]RZU66028.1 adenine-specific DNA-methyltransferase [Microterricola gilva]